jgi:hypothetical protein
MKESKRFAKGLKFAIALPKKFYEKKNSLEHIQQKEMKKIQLINPKLE